MNKIKSTIIGISLIGTMSLSAEMNHNNMDHSKMNHTKSIEKKAAGVKLNNLKPLTVGSNEIELVFDKKITGKVKVKFFMPEMPGMPYMESLDKQLVKDGKSNIKINFPMGGTWQYQIKTKDSNDKIDKYRGSINL